MDNTLNEIKQQWQLLQDKLESQSIVNDKLIRRIINSNARSINRHALLVTVMAALAIPYCTWLLLWMHISLAFTIVTVVFLLAAVCYNIYTHRRVQPAQLAQSSLAEVTCRVARMKMLYARWLRFSIPFIICWFAWFVYEIMTLAGMSHDERTGILVGGVVGGVIGAALGIYTYRRTQHLASEILDQVRDCQAPTP